MIVSSGLGSKVLEFSSKRNLRSRIQLKYWIQSSVLSFRIGSRHSRIPFSDPGGSGIQHWIQYPVLSIESSVQF